ncbi:mammalian cell entry protein [Mycolicibacterium mengxianglii]|uniref:mammalian cell entry protein n=1 Tax=Mycolicibacterium mengxianglii TaxID=2736649 RepID=UPI0018EF2D5E|nr:mammalian cell entry protein [Mycolicibacterium mengxianglii]
MRRRTAWLLASLSVIVVAGIVALAAIGAGLYWDRIQTTAQQDTRTELLPLAADQIPKVFGYDYQTVEGSLTDASNLLTPDYRREFQSQATEKIIPEARKRQVVSQANVVGVGILAAQRNSGSVMVYMNRTVTDQSEESVYEGSRLKVDYQKVDGKWLISYITPI